MDLGRDVRRQGAVSSLSASCPVCLSSLLCEDAAGCSCRQGLSCLSSACLLLGLRGLDCDQERGPCRSRVVPSDQREQGPTLKAPRAAGLQVLSVRRRVTVAAIKPPNSWSSRDSVNTAEMYETAVLDQITPPLRRYAHSASALLRRSQSPLFPKSPRLRTSQSVLKPTCLSSSIFT